MPDTFVHLHNHSTYSLLDGANKITPMVEAAGRMGMPAVALTDHGVMYGALEFYSACKDAGLKPILGCEVYVARRSRHQRQGRQEDDSYHLVLLAQNLDGYRNLMALVSRAFMEGFYYKPRVDRDLLRQYGSGLFCLSACLGGEVPQAILRGDMAGARDTALFLKETFADGQFYLELQNHGLKEQASVNERLVELAHEIKVPLICTNDAHYLAREDADLHDTLLCVQTNTTKDDPNRLRYGSEEFYFKTPQAMRELFAAYPTACDHTLEIAERCNVELELGKTYLPHYEVPQGETYDSHLRRQCEAGLRRLYPRPSQEVFDRLNYELKVIGDKGFSAYFLIVQDFARFAQSRGILARARGSAAGSLVSYLLGLTNIDPLEWGLLFERFLVPERITPPDIDMDFEDTRREEVIQYVRDKYGEDRVAQIITFGTMAARAAVRDAGRALGIPLARVDQVAKLIPFGSEIDAALDTIAELKQIAAEDPQIASLLKTAKGLVGVPRHASTHAAGVVIASEAVYNLVPIQKMGESGVVTQFDMNNVAKAGLLKMDFLGLSYLSVVARALALIKETTGEEIDLDKDKERIDIARPDPKTYELLRRADTIAVFQLESEGMRRLLKDLEPTEFEDIIAAAALYRPGPLQNGDTQEYVRRKHQMSPVTYIDPSVAPILEPILRRTYGILVYQEQAMRIAMDLAGFRAIQADALRTAMSKKKLKEMEKLRADFIEGVLARSIKRVVAEKIFEAMLSFSAYAFSLNHSAAYAVLAYQTAWLKANYPAQFMAAKMTAEMDNKDKVALYVEDCKKFGIEVKGPDVNRSGLDFTVEETSAVECIAGGAEGRRWHIRFGLAAIKNVGRGAMEAALACRSADGPFKSFLDFCMRVDSTAINRSTLESLIACGAFDSLHVNRNQLLGCVEQAVSIVQRESRQRGSSQVSMFGTLGDEELAAPELKLPDVAEMEHRKKLGHEKSLLGLYLSDHPLRHVRHILARHKHTPCAELTEVQDRQDVTVAGIISGMQRKVSKQTNREWMLITLEDLTGTVTVSLFPKAFEEYGKLIAREKVVVVQGKASHRERVRGEEEDAYTVEVAADRVIEIDTGEPEPEQATVHVRLPERFTVRAARELREIAEKHPGISPLVVHVNGSALRSRSLQVALTPEFRREVEGLLSNEGQLWTVAV